MTPRAEPPDGPARPVRPHRAGHGAADRRRSCTRSSASRGTQRRRSCGGWSPQGKLGRKSGSGFYDATDATRHARRLHARRTPAGPPWRRAGCRGPGPIGRRPSAPCPRRRCGTRSTRRGRTAPCGRRGRAAVAIPGPFPQNRGAEHPSAWKAAWPPRARRRLLVGSRPRSELRRGPPRGPGSSTGTRSAA